MLTLPVCGHAQDVEPIDLPSDAEFRAFLEEHEAEWQPRYRSDLELQDQTGQLIRIDRMQCAPNLVWADCSASVAYRFENGKVEVRECQFTFSRDEAGELQSVIVMVHERRRVVRDTDPIVTIPDATIQPDFGLQLPDER